MNELKNSFKKIKTSLSNKELNQHVIPISDFTKHFTNIIEHFNKDEATKFIALETSLIIANLLIENNMNNEALTFITHSVYVSCPNIDEVSKVFTKN